MWADKLWKNRAKKLARRRKWRATTINWRFTHKTEDKGESVAWRSKDDKKKNDWLRQNIWKQTYVFKVFPGTNLSLLFMAKAIRSSLKHQLFVQNTSSRVKMLRRLSCVLTGRSPIFMVSHLSQFRVIIMLTTIESFIFECDLAQQFASPTNDVCSERASSQDFIIPYD